jgi:ubiquinol-cytochrome c reductase iron-sulfur subunit
MAETHSSTASMPGAGASTEPGEPPTRRDFLLLTAGALGAVGAATVAYALIDSLNPAADILAAGGPVDVDLSRVLPGQQIVVLWRSRPIFIIDRTPPLLQTLQDAKLVERLSDPNSQADQQPPYARNWHRSIDPKYAVLVGICTHLGCIPLFYPNPDASNPAANWLGGYFCPCHGSKYDLAGRVFSGVPAPYNLPVPPYHFPDKTTVRIGENPPGEKWDFSSILQL